MRRCFIIFLLLPIMGFAAEGYCPDLSDPQHPTLRELGWELSPFSSKSATGAHTFSSVTLTNFKMGGISNLACSYDQDQVVIYRQGKFSHPDDPALWYHTHDFDQCSDSLNACKFYTF